MHERYHKTKKYGQSWACWWRLKLAHNHTADSWLGIQLCYFRPQIEIHAERQTLEHSRNMKWQHGSSLFGFVRNLGRICLILSESFSKSSICVNSWPMSTHGQWPEHTCTHAPSHPWQQYWAEEPHHHHPSNSHARRGQAHIQTRSIITRSRPQSKMGTNFINRKYFMELIFFKQRPVYLCKQIQFLIIRK